MTDASKLTDDELIDEMLKRFIVPQFYTRENVEERWGIENDDEFEIIQDELHKLYLEVDDIADEAVANIKEHLKCCEDDDEGEELKALEEENKKLKMLLHTALKLDDTIAISKFEKEEIKTIENLKKVNEKLRDLYYVVLTQKEE